MEPNQYIILCEEKDHEKGIVSITKAFNTPEGCIIRVTTMLVQDTICGIPTNITETLTHVENVKVKRSSLEQPILVDMYNDDDEENCSYQRMDENCKTCCDFDHCVRQYEKENP